MDLVVGASEASMKSLLGKLGGILAQEYSVIRGVRGDIQYINDELATIQAFLGDLYSSPDGHDLRLKDWMKQIRDMAYDMEDCIDDFAHRVPLDSLDDAKCSFIMTRIHELWTFWPRREIASNISELKVRAQHIAERRTRYGLNNPTPTKGNSNSNSSSSRTGSIAEHIMSDRQLIHSNKPMGEVKDMENLRDWLKHNDSANHYSVLSLVGFGGVGKTTIATALFRECRNEFDCQASVTVSQNYDEQQFLRDILGQIKPQVREQEKQESNTESSLDAKNLLADITRSVKRYLPLIWKQGSGDNSRCKKEPAVSDQVNTTQEEKSSNKPHHMEKKNLVADIKSSIKRLWPLSWKQGSGDNSRCKKEPVNRDQQVLDQVNTPVKEKRDIPAGHVKPRDHSEHNNHQLKEDLQKHLAEKRYLLLIDDIWSADTWRKIRRLFPDNKRNSRVIVTTRFQSVGAACSGSNGTDLLHTVDVLSRAFSKSLFNHSVSKPQSSKEPVDDLSSKGYQTDHLPEVGEQTDDSGIQLNRRGTESKNSSSIENKKAPEEIWEYGGGLPLAIVIMAGLVACNPKQNNGYWSKVFKSIFPEQVAPLTLDGVTKILDYCYNDLPSDLKTCCLYLSIFPKGVAVSRKRLIRRWISEFIVTEKQGLTAEEVAETYFDQLISRKIIRPVAHSSNGKVKSFKVHDMILEYIVSKSSEETFITVVGGHLLLPPPSNKVRRLSIQSNSSRNGNSTKGMNLSQVRSLTVFGSKKHGLPFHSFNNGIIQVLDLEGWKGLEQKHLIEICKMVVLRYLSLRRTDVRVIPSMIEKLEYLETLDIRETNVVVLPKCFGQHKLLHSLLGGSKNPRKPLKLTNTEPMKALRILSGIEITQDSAAAASLHQLTGLMKLAIYKLDIKKGTDAFTELLSSIEYLCSCGLQTLAINDEGSEFINSLDSMSAPPRYLISLELSGKMERPPNWIQNLINLYKLTLSVTVLKADTFKLVQDLPKLFSLTFTLSAAKNDADILDILEENKEHTRGEIIVPSGGFKSLKLLRFFATVVPRLSFAVTREQVMPALERIDMQFQAFEGIHGIETLQSLQEVHVSVSNQADDITKFLVEDLKDTTKFFCQEDHTKWPKIICD